jgi:hypothetical protein
MPCGIVPAEALVGEARTRIAVSAALAALLALALAGTGSAATAKRQFGSFTYTNVHPGKPTGIVADFTFVNPGDKNVKPYSVAKMVVRAPAPNLIDTVHFPRCHASDAELQSQGFDGCPANTQIGHGLVRSDTGSGSGESRYSHTPVRDFNGDHEVIGVGENKEIPAIRSVDHTKLHGRDSTTVFPSFPGFPPPDAYTPIKTLHIVFGRHVRNGHTYARTPPSCPKSRRWTIEVTFTYHDGVVQTLKSKSPCRRR